jgi:hypothetical protein
MMRESNGVERIVANQLIERLDVAIRNAVREGKYKIQISIPTFLYGTPAFDRDDVEKKVRNVFRDNGFVVKTVDAPSHTFEVSWLNIEIDEERSTDVEEASKKVTIL